MSTTWTCSHSAADVATTFTFHPSSDIPVPPPPPFVPVRTEYRKMHAPPPSPNAWPFSSSSSSGSTSWAWSPHLPASSRHPLISTRQSPDPEAPGRKRDRRGTSVSPLTGLALGTRHGRWDAVQSTEDCTEHRVGVCTVTETCWYCGLRKLSEDTVPCVQKNHSRLRLCGPYCRLRCSQAPATVRMYIVTVVLLVS